MIEQLAKNIIELLYYFLNDADSFRTTSKYLNKIISPKYFLNKTFNTDFIKKKDRCEFRYFVNKYKLCINIKPIKNIEQLIYFGTYNIKKLQLEYYFNSTYAKHLLFSLNLSKLKKLNLSGTFNQSINNISFPTTLTSLSFSDSFNHQINSNVLPTSLKSLYFGESYNYKITQNIFPLSLKKLMLSNVFNQQIDENVLPQSLEVLMFGDKYNQPIKEHVLPSTLKKLILGNEFNQPLKNIIFPSSIKKLIFE
jgi:hypothetical protein